MQRHERSKATEQLENSSCGNFFICLQKHLIDGQWGLLRLWRIREVNKVGVNR